MAPVEILAVQRAATLQPPPPKGSPHGVALPGTKRDGRSAIYRHWRFQDELLKTLDPSVTTCHEAFEQTAKAAPKRNCLGHRPYHRDTKTFGDYVWQDYETVQRRRKNLGAGIVRLHREAGITEQKYGVGLWCQNRPEWQIVDLACMSQSLFSVSLYDTLGPDTTEYIINHVGMTCVATSLSHITTLLKLKPRLPTLKFIICLDPLSEGERLGESKGEILNAIAQDLDISIYSIQDVEAIGESTPIPYNPPTAEDIVTINYTSGTTGDPKGVVLTHAAAIAAASVSLLVIDKDAGDRLLSFLPLAHIYQRVGEHSALWSGTSIGYFHGNILELADDIKLLRPTVFSAVPRLYNRFGGLIKAATIQQGGVRGALSRRVVSTKLANIKAPEGTATNKHLFYDRIWAKKVSAAIGLDQCVTMVSGAAPLDPSLHQFLRIVFANDFKQGYGLTETYAASMAQLKDDMSSGNCGPPAATHELCLLDVPDMDYLSTDKPHPRGELLIRATSLFREYYKNEKETTKSIDSDGWFHTGDICSVDELGRFKIIDRVKNVLKLAQGEYLSPERIENVILANCSWLQIAYVHGDSHQSFLVAIFGIAPDAFAPFASKLIGKEYSVTDLKTLESVAQEPKVRKAVIKELDKVAKRNKFNSYEKVRDVRLLVDPFTIDNELLTPTLKLKRAQAARKYRHLLDEMYENTLAEDENKPRAKL
ncbi:long-chain-fatty-acid-CoA ligase/ protein binding protein [Patellaria atrata CBS 101060]|uniref:Long-chain-fatty-acid-CoA ligase/ protein binding protein n=1 Tax=Patellaria atrata CBS 101060 TaxID=1346257 RepID=A0A9P4SDB5_9PEZI|nr:long-chain-fatty-acid-CoA ligase/ protein binding protein [Patellaria atrata CBS 101060]